MTQTILILEDDPIRHKAFLKNFAGFEITIVAKASEAIQKLTDNTYDYLSLDHDLGGQENVSSGPGTGYEVACWLADHPDRMPTTLVILHSGNPAGRANMKRVLPDAIEAYGIWMVNQSRK